MGTYKITGIVSSSESDREELRREAARAVYAELLKYCGKNNKAETPKYAKE
mgnify:CR=1 FL=1